MNRRTTAVFSSDIANPLGSVTPPEPTLPPYSRAVELTRELEPWEPLLESGRADERLVHDDLYEAHSARLVSVPADLNGAVRQALEEVGISHLYAHQAEALQAAFDGPTIVTTGTASGKSLCFQLPTLEVLTTDRTAR